MMLSAAAAAAAAATNAATNGPKPDAAQPLKADAPLLTGDLLLQTGIGEWSMVSVQLLENGLSVQGAEDAAHNIFFRPESRVVIPMRNLRREAQYKGCAFQIESASEMKTFIAPTLADKNTWARKLNMALSELKNTGRYAFVLADENTAPTTPAKPVKVIQIQNSAEKQNQQRAAVQQLAQSLQSKRTAARVPESATPTQQPLLSATTPSTAPPARVQPTFGGVNIDRTAEIEALQRTIQEREKVLAAKEGELCDALQRLQSERQYREQITAGVEKWREDVTKQGQQKLADTLERLQDEQKRVDGLEKEKKSQKLALEASAIKIAELEEHVRTLEAEAEEGRGLRRELAELRTKLDKEMAFVLVLEQDTRQMAEELLEVGEKYAVLKEHYHRDTHALRDQCHDLKTQLSAKEEECMQLKEELGRLRVENKRLQDGQHKMTREFFFSLALSIKLSLAQQGFYSNVDVNSLYEQILSVEYSQWHRWLEAQLRSGELTASRTAAAAATEPDETPVHTPLGAPGRRAQPDRSAKKKTGFLGGLFN